MVRAMAEVDGGSLRPSGAGSLVLACDFAPPSGGNFLDVELAVARAARATLGLETVFALPARAQGRPWVARVGASGCAAAFLPAAARRRPFELARVASEADARILHTHFTWFDLDALYAGSRTGAPVVWHLHNGLDGYPLRQRATDVVKARALARRCAAIVACSDHVRADALRRGFPAAKVETIVNGLVLDRFAHPAAAPAAVRTALGVPDGAFLVVSFCSPAARKGADVLLDGLSRVVARQGGGRLAAVLVGDDGVRRVLDGHRGPLPWVRVVPRVEDVASLLGAADVFVSAAREEGFSYAVGEVMLAGLPVVGSDIGGTSHYWGAPGFLRFPVGDSAGLADLLAGLAAGTTAGALGAANRSWASAHLGAGRYVDETVGLYARLLDGVARTAGATAGGGR